MFTNQFIRATVHFPVLNPTEYRYTQFDSSGGLCSALSVGRGKELATLDRTFIIITTDTYLPT